MCTLLTQTFCLMCHTQVLRLSNNNIGDAGLTALAKAVESGALPQLKELGLGSNSIGDVGLSALADVVSRGGVGRIQRKGKSEHSSIKFRRTRLPTLTRSAGDVHRFLTSPTVPLTVLGRDG